MCLLSSPCPNHSTRSCPRQKKLHVYLWGRKSCSAARRNLQISSTVLCSSGSTSSLDVYLRLGSTAVIHGRVLCRRTINSSQKPLQVPPISLSPTTGDVHRETPALFPSTTGLRASDQSGFLSRLRNRGDTVSCPDNNCLLTLPVLEPGQKVYLNLSSQAFDAKD
jgi:hypothetical protein